MGRHKPKLAPIYERDWMQAVPLTAAAKIWPVDESTLRRWANEGKIAAWQPGRNWFVSALSLIRLCGMPQDERYLLEKLPSLR